MPPHIVRINTRQSSFALTGVLLSPPHSPSLWKPGLWEALAWWAWNLSKGLRRASAEDCWCRPLWSLMNHLHLQQKGPLWGLGWARPSDNNFYLLDSAGHACGQSGPLWTLAFLRTLHSWVAASFFGWLTSVVTRLEGCVLNQGVFPFIHFSWGSLLTSISKKGPREVGICPSLPSQPGLRQPGFPDRSQLNNLSLSNVKK